MQNNISKLPTWDKSIIKRTLNDGWQIIAVNESGKEIMAMAAYFDNCQEAAQMGDQFLEWKMCSTVSVES